MTKFKGVIPPVVTPLNADFTVDYPSYTRVLEHLIEGGCHGVFVLGSTSEVIFHDDKTRREIIEHSAKVVNGRGACQEVVMSDPDLSKIPILTCWPQDGGHARA